MAMRPLAPPPPTASRQMQRSVSAPPTTALCSPKPSSASKYSRAEFCCQQSADIGALMRKKRLLVGTSGVGSGGLPSCRGSAAPASSHFAAGLGLDLSVENPVYSPDDSLAKAASKLQSLKALKSSAAHPLAQCSGSSAPIGPLQPSTAAPVPAGQAPPGGAPVTAPAGAAAAAGGQMAVPPPQPCDSPPVHDVAKHALQSAEAGQRLRCAGAAHLLAGGEPACVYANNRLCPPAPALSGACQGRAHPARQGTIAGSRRTQTGIPANPPAPLQR